VGIGGGEFTFSEESATRRQPMAIRASGRDEARTIQWLIGWPQEPELDWRKGFLAGVFDAVGSFSGGIPRIAHTDPEIIRWTGSWLESLGFAFERSFFPGKAVIQPGTGLGSACPFVAPRRVSL